jgi:ABC-2 type transport system ATP-binding protein
VNVVTPLQAPALVLRAVSKHFGRHKVVAVEEVSLTVRKGEIFGVLGANGSGKSTLIRLISTLLLPDSGTLEVFGLNVVEQELQVKRLINRVSVDAAFFRS